MHGLSIIICTYNGVERLEQTLKSICSLEVVSDLDLEVLLIDNKSTDETSFYSNNYLIANSPFQFRIILEEEPGLNHARKRGLLESKYDWILFCDDDNHLFSNYINIAYNFIKNHNDIGVLGGHGLPVFESEPPVWFNKYAHSYAVGAQSDSTGAINKYPAEVYGAGCFFRKDPLLKFFNNGFNTIMSDRIGNKLISGGDVEWCYIVQLTGYKIYYHDDLKFKHLMPANRLTWDYYLRLKSGISYSAGPLTSYKIIFIYGSTINSITYFFRYFFELLKVFINYLKFIIRSLILPRSYNQDTIDLANIIFKSKLDSYFKNIFLSYKHYSQLKRFKNASI
jgi:glycosyltransferase involved in cell wall biosynthesis